MAIYELRRQQPCIGGRVIMDDDWDEREIAPYIQLKGVIRKLEAAQNAVY